MQVIVISPDFSQALKVEGDTVLTKDEWIAIVEQKKRENINPFWSIYEFPW